MRAFYTRTPRAGFYQSCPYTMAYHRDYVEIIWNLGPGAYGVVWRSSGISVREPMAWSI